MHVLVESKLPCPANLAWDEVQKSSLLCEVTQPLLAVQPMHGESLPPRWSHHGIVHCRLHLFGFFPMGGHTIRFERVDAATREIRTHERGCLVRRWDHVIRIRDAGNGACLYADDVSIEAGWLTPLVWLFACWFYRHRQRRWVAVVHRLVGGE